MSLEASRYNAARGPVSDDRTAYEMIRQAFEDRGSYTPGWTIPALLTSWACAISGFLAFFASVVGRGGTVSTKYFVAAIAVLVLGATSYWAGVKGHVERQAVPEQACPALDTLGAGPAAALADVLRRARPEEGYGTRIGAEAAVYRNRAAVLAALRLSASARALAVDASDPAALDHLIAAARAAG